MRERKFTKEDQDIFARLSGDYNTLHVDEIMARRYLFGGTVVHGMHIMLWALDKWLELPKSRLEITDLRVVFNKNLRVGESITCDISSEANDHVELSLYSEGIIFVTVSVKWKLAGAEAEGTIISKFPEHKVCKVLLTEEIKNASGELELCVEKEAANRLFPNIVKYLPLTQTAELLATTRLVGMECPGFHSIFYALNANFEYVKVSPFVLKFRVKKFDPRFSLSIIEVQGPSMKGTIEAFLRPPVSQQASFSDLCKIVTPDEFKEQSAFIIGGSRGLGEVASKLLAAGGARIILTYYKGDEDARRVTDEIISQKGQAQTMYFNVLAPGESQVDQLVKFSPTHLYYFATPHITTSNRGFSVNLFSKFCDYYVKGFSDTLDFFLQHCSSLRQVFYPSSVFVDQPPVSLGEYACAKAAGETLCLFLRNIKKDIFIHSPRLPMMTTDQTPSLMLDNYSDPAPIMLKQLRDFKNSERSTS